MGLFGKKCEYCHSKIAAGEVIEKEVKIPGYLGVHKKNFCSQQHVENYEAEIAEQAKSKKGGGGCC